MGPVFENIKSEEFRFRILSGASHGHQAIRGLPGSATGPEQFHVLWFGLGTVTRETYHARAHSPYLVNVVSKGSSEE